MRSKIPSAPETDTRRRKFSADPANVSSVSTLRASAELSCPEHDRPLQEEACDVPSPMRRCQLYSVVASCTQRCTRAYAEHLGRGTSVSRRLRRCAFENIERGTESVCFKHATRGIGERPSRPDRYAFKRCVHKSRHQVLVRTSMGRVIRFLDRDGVDLDIAAVARRSSCISQASSAGTVTSEGAAKLRIAFLRTGDADRISWLHRRKEHR